MQISVTMCDRCGKLHVDPDHVHIRPGDQLEWDCAANMLEIDFGHDSPFATTVLSAKGRGLVKIASGPQRPVRVAKVYKYTVHVASDRGEFTLDPEVVVDPP